MQLCSRALTSLKYFAEAYAQAPQKYDYHIIAEGSQLGINVSSSASFPVGKVFALDVGLLGCMVKLDAKQVVLIKDLYFQFRGALAENFIAQELFAHGHNPIYYFKKDSSAEVDFMIDHESQSFAIEVKSGENKTSKSLNALLKKHAQIKGVRLSSSNINFANSIIEMPLYLTSALGNLS